MRQRLHVPTSILLVATCLFLAQNAAAQETILIFELDELRSTWSQSLDGQGSGGLLQGSLSATVVGNNVTFQNIDVAQYPSGDPDPLSFVFPNYPGVLNGSDVAGSEDVCPGNPPNEFEGTISSQVIDLTGQYVDCCGTPPCRHYTYNFVGSVIRAEAIPTLSPSARFVFAALIGAAAILVIRRHQ